jgi:hypothetical protein
VLRFLVVPFSRVLLAAAVALLAAALPSSASAARAGNGQLAYDGQASSSGALLLRAPKGRSVRRLSAPGNPVDPAFSPTGRRIAFTSRNEIWVMYEDGTNMRQVTVGALPNRDPSWSPGSDQLAFATGKRGRRDLYAVGADGGGLRRVTSGRGDDTAPAWSSRDQIAFVRSYGGDGSIYRVAGGGGRVRALTAGDADDRAPTWSPDGRRIAFTRLAEPERRGGRRRSPKPRRELWIMRANGTKERRVKLLPAAAGAPSWSPDGRRIAFVMRVKRRSAIHTIRTDGRGLRKVANVARGARTVDWQPRGADPVIAAAGDIACDPGHGNYEVGLGSADACHMRQTSDLLMRMDLSAILPLGDLQYEDGEYTKFLRSFDRTWGRLKNLIKPVPGNHQYVHPGAHGYFDYFNGPGVFAGQAGERGKGYYSYDVGNWHIVALNSQCSHAPKDDQRPGCEAGSEQERWLRADLAASEKPCTLAYMHHPRMSSGLRDNPAVQPLWQALYDHGAELVLAGHHHSYERFAPMTPDGARDGARGIRQIVSGTGGRSHHAFDTVLPNSEVRNNTTFGVLKLTLRPNAYLWEFVPEAGGTFTDSGANACH